MLFLDEKNRIIYSLNSIVNFFFNEIEKYFFQFTNLIYLIYF